MKEGELSMYYVKKHGGNSNHKWRIVLETDNREKAIAKFDCNVPRTLVTLVMSKWHDNN